MNTCFKNCFLKIIKKFWLLLFFVPILIAFEEYLRIFSYPHKYKNDLVFSSPFLNEMLKQGYYFNTHRIILKLKKRSEDYFLSKLFKQISKSSSIKKNIFRK